jgi:hypothetical protein
LTATPISRHLVGLAAPLIPGALDVLGRVAEGLLAVLPDVEDQQIALGEGRETGQGMENRELGALLHGGGHVLEQLGIDVGGQDLHLVLLAVEDHHELLIQGATAEEHHLLGVQVVELVGDRKYRGC